MRDYLKFHWTAAMVQLIKHLATTCVISVAQALATREEVKDIVYLYFYSTWTGAYP
jgi:hypothetical protein